MKTYYTYILTNNSHKTLYIGVTNNLMRRLWEHKTGANKGFTKKYNCHKLVFFEETDDISAAIEREKQLKNWHRSWKIDLIAENNPQFQDLSKDWFDEIP